jgi:hypothetical protein
VEDYHSSLGSWHKIWGARRDAVKDWSRDVVKRHELNQIALIDLHITAFAPLWDACDYSADLQALNSVSTIVA